MRFILLLALCASYVFAPVTKILAQNYTPSSASVDILPAKAAQNRGLMYNTDDITHPEIRMTPDKSEIIPLDGKAVSIIIGNPQHLSIAAESPSLLVLSPRAPGATSFAVLNAQGEILMQRHVIVDAPKERYLRVRKSCTGSNDKSCETTHVYYCPGMCHRILLDDGSEPETAQSDDEKDGQSSNTSEQDTQTETGSEE